MLFLSIYPCVFITGLNVARYGVDL